MLDTADISSQNGYPFVYRKERADQTRPSSDSGSTRKPRSIIIVVLVPATPVLVAFTGSSLLAFPGCAIAETAWWRRREIGAWARLMAPRWAGVRRPPRPK